MAKYLLKVSYTADGARGLLDKGGSSRRAAVNGLVEQMGGTLEAFYFALGEDDAYVIADVPDITDLVAVSLAVAAAGGARFTSVPLLTPEQLDAAAKREIGYQAPGA